MSHPYTLSYISPPWMNSSYQLSTSSTLHCLSSWWAVWSRMCHPGAPPGFDTTPFFLEKNCLWNRFPGLYHPGPAKLWFSRKVFSNFAIHGLITSLILVGFVMGKYRSPMLLHAFYFSLKPSYHTLIRLDNLPPDILHLKSWSRTLVSYVVCMASFCVHCLKTSWQDA